MHPATAAAGVRLSRSDSFPDLRKSCAIQRANRPQSIRTPSTYTAIQIVIAAITVGPAHRRIDTRQPASFSRRPRRNGSATQTGGYESYDRDQSRAYSHSEKPADVAAKPIGAQRYPRNPGVHRETTGLARFCGPPQASSTPNPNTAITPTSANTANKAMAANRPIPAAAQLERIGNPAATRAPIASPCGVCFSQ